ncbi:MAG TPA: flagellin [Bacteroidota bacterium]|nr:flagellin [Bacteroidota bacterium]
MASTARINTNIAALNALNALNSVNADLQVHQLRLASGKRINTAADDPSGFVISSKMGGTLAALSAASDNVSSAQNIYNVAEGGYQTIANLMTQIKAQQTEFNNGGLGTDEQNAIATTISDLAKEIDSTIAQTQYNGINLINGSFVAGVGQSGGSLTSGVASADGTVTGVDVSGAKASDTYTLSNVGAVLTLTRSSDNATASVTMGASTVGGAQTLNFANLGVSISYMGTAAATGAASATALVGAGTTITTNAGSTPSFQVGDTGANFGMSLTTAVDSTSLLGTAAGSITAAQVAGLTVDTGMTTVLDAIGSIGAQQNRLMAKQTNLSTMITNITASKSQITDADIAVEQIASVKDQILQQTATAQLAQANQSPQVFLSLFK